MKKVIILKGNSDLIYSKRYRRKANKFYNSLYTIFKNSGCKVTLASSNYGGTLDKALVGYDIIVGHSRGASRIAEWFSEDLFPHVEAVLLFDPKEEYLRSNTHWNDLNIKKRIFASEIRDENDPDDDYSLYDKVVYFKDDHYFNESLNEIRYQINDMLR